ncbi:MAG: EMC3/TMCO1 family protein [Thermoplasmata archaeon]|nr:EMC3/TMCO1 family protein [Thermoplasmata archaeon]
MAEDAPLPAGDAAEDAEEVELEKEIDTEAARKPPAPAFKATTFLYTFLFLLGILMLFDGSTRTGVSLALDRVLSPSIGLGGRFPLVTMFLAAVVEMLITAIAYNYTTDWVKAARVQRWSTSLRKVQMEAMRSGKKDRVDALKQHQLTLQKLSGEVSVAQLKGMAITWFLVIAIYNWVYLYLATGSHTLVSARTSVVNLGGSSVDLLGHLGSLPIPVWFVLFSIFTVPLSLLFRRALKHYTLARHPAAVGLPPVPKSQGTA